MGLSEGVETFQILRDLRFIKLPEDVRHKVKKLNADFKTRHLTHQEEVWIRKQYDRRKKQIFELHQMEQNARETDARLRRGSARDKMLRLRAKRETARRLREKRARLEAEIAEIEASEKDFGI